jgi:hypothetical protein
MHHFTAEFGMEPFRNAPDQQNSTNIGVSMVRAHRATGHYTGAMFAAPGNSGKPAICGLLEACRQYCWSR